jgi:hypothetical protein
MVERARAVVGGALFLGLLCSACSMSAPTNRLDGGSDSVSSAAEYAAALCKLVTPCCAAAQRSSDDARCRSALDLSAYDAALASRLGFDADSARKCLTQLSGVTDFCADPDGVVTSIAACGHIYPGAKTAQPSDAAVGSLQPGEACKQDGDCAPANDGVVRCVSSRNGSSFSYQCQVQVAGKLGDGPCSATTDATGYAAESETAGLDAGVPAARTIACDHTSGAACDFATHRCVALGALGQACVADLQCVDAAYCDCGGGSLCSPGSATCTARRVAGASCTPPFVYHQCLKTDYCDAQSSTCKALLEAGQPCTESSACTTRLCAGHVCVTRGQAFLGIACSPP